MKPVVVSVKNLSKTYNVYTRPIDLIKEVFFKGRKRHQESVALSDISFDMFKGEVVGIIGRNGAGKSTLLKILAGKLDPTAGEVKIIGKISAILELGTGFNPELSGRENVIMGAMFVGMTKSEALQKLDTIIEFSGLKEVIDRPFKTFSSGMQARLTFATAISIDPDILIVDEALAAGDAFFINKSLKRIEEICKSGATVLFVSHSLNLVERFCHRAMLIDNGRIVDFGETKKVAKNYELMVIKDQNMSLEERQKERAFDRVGTGEVLIENVEILDHQGKPTDILTVGEKVTFRIHAKSEREGLPLIYSLLVYSAAGTVAFSTCNESYINNQGEESYFNLVTKLGANSIDIELDHLLLGRGSYHLSVGLHPSVKTQSLNDYYDYIHMRWNFSVVRNGTFQWVFYEQPVSFNVK